MMSRRWFAGLLFWFAGVCSADPAVVQGVRLWTGPDNTRVVIDLNGPAQHKLFTLSGPDRVVIDLHDTRLKPGVSAKGSQGVIQGLRTGIQNGRDLRVVLDLKGTVKPRSFLLKPDGGNGHRLVVDLQGNPAMSAKPAKPAVAAANTTPVAKQKPSVAKTSATQRDNVAVAKRDADAKVAEPSVKTAAAQARIESKPHSAAKPSSAAEPPGETSSQREAVTAAQAVPVPAKPAEPVKSLRDVSRGRELIIAIDAGHGGEDPGAIGPNKQREKHIVMAIARELNALLQADRGFRPTMIRTGDYYISLAGRRDRGDRHDVVTLARIQGRGDGRRRVVHVDHVRALRTEHVQKLDIVRAREREG